MKKVIIQNKDAGTILDEFLKAYPFFEDLGAQFKVSMEDDEFKIGAIIIGLGNNAIIYPFKISEDQTLILPSVFYDIGEDFWKEMNRKNILEILGRTESLQMPVVSKQPRGTSKSLNFVGSNMPFRLKTEAQNTLPVPGVLAAIKQSDKKAELIYFDSEAKRKTADIDDLEYEIWEYGVPTDIYDFKIGDKEAAIIYLNGLTRKTAEPLTLEQGQQITSDSKPGLYQIFTGLDDKGVPRGTDGYVFTSVRHYPWESGISRVLVTTGNLYDIGDQFVGVFKSDALPESVEDLNINDSYAFMFSDGSVSMPFKVVSRFETGTGKYSIKDLETGKVLRLYQTHPGVPIYTDDKNVIIDVDEVKIIKLGVKTNLPKTLKLAEDNEYIKGVITKEPDGTFTIIYFTSTGAVNVKGLNREEAVSQLVSVGLVPSSAWDFVQKAHENGKAEFEAMRSAENIIHFLINQEKKAEIFWSLALPQTAKEEFYSIKNAAKDVLGGIADYPSLEEDPIYPILEMIRSITEKDFLSFLLSTPYIAETADAVAKDLLNAEFNEVDDDVIDILKTTLSFLERTIDLVKKFYASESVQ